VKKIKFQYNLSSWLGRDLASMGGVCQDENPPPKSGFTTT